MSNQPELKIELTLKDRVIKTYTFSQAEVMVGRDPTADIIIDNPGISRFHMKIEMNAGGTYVAKDMGSTNGIFLNSQLVHEEPLRNNDIITLGKFNLKVGIEKSEAPRFSQKQQGQQRAKDDIDGTTVLSKEQMAAMMASAQAEAARKSAGEAAKTDSSAGKGLPMGLVIVGGVVVLAVIAVVAFFALR